MTKLKDFQRIEAKERIKDMSHWNYRIFEYSDGTLGIHETYYDKDGKVNGWTLLPLFTGDSVKELLEVLEMIKKDIKRFPKSLKYKK